MKKLDSLLDRQRIEAWIRVARPWLEKAWVLAREFAAVAYKYGRIAAREAAIILRRLPIASLSFANALASPEYAEELRALHADRASTPGLARSAVVPSGPPAGHALLARPAELQHAPPDSALLLLGLLQKEGRFIDFMQEDVTTYSDADVGAAARVVHQGCAKVLSRHLRIEPVRSENEGAHITLEPGFDPAEVRPTGQVIGEPPFTGSLVHRGWRAVSVDLPQVSSSRDLRILAVAEVEL